MWIVGTVLFVLAVAFVSYGEIKRQFEPREETSVPVQCGLARGKAGTDYAVKKTSKPGPWDAYAERNPDAPCWYAISKFRTFYPEYKDLTDTELIVKLNVALNLITFDHLPYASPWPTVAFWASIAFGIPLALGASLVWAFSGFSKCLASRRGQTPVRPWRGLSVGGGEEVLILSD